MYKYRVTGEKDGQFRVLDLLEKDTSILSAEKTKALAAKGMITNVIVRDGEMLKVKDAYTAYQPLREIFLTNSNAKGLVKGEQKKNSILYTIRLFDDFNRDITQLVYNFLYSELDLEKNQFDSILLSTKSLDPLGIIRDEFNKKCQRVQKYLAVERVDEMMSSIIHLDNICWVFLEQGAKLY